MCLCRSVTVYGNVRTGCRLSSSGLAPREVIDAKVRAAMTQFDVVWFGVDPSPAEDDSTETLYWRSVIDAWHRDYRTKLQVWATALTFSTTWPGRNSSDPPTGTFFSRMMVRTWSIPACQGELSPLVHSKSA
jgi:hypothetical protein